MESQNWNDVENRAGIVLKRMDQIAEKRDIMEQKSKMDKVDGASTLMLGTVEVEDLDFYK